MNEPLYTLTKIDLKTGNRIVIYGHATANVMSEYWEAYTNEKYAVEIRVFKKEDHACSACDV